MSDRTFRRWVRELRKLAPIDKPTAVRRVRFLRDPSTRRGHCGECRMSPRGVTIEIEETLDRASTIDTLLHEWAHAMREEFDGGEDAAHDDQFWILFGSLYRAFFRTE